ncbi:MAG: hypothetical protein HC858_12805, partial [Brachymonas sp.]|nr:hypothetical protein [Brachymonas sp.]
MDLRWEILAPYASLFVKGTVMTVQLTVIALALGLLAGLFIGLLTAQPQSGWKNRCAGSAWAMWASFAAHRSSCKSC